jgi:putative heme-binding domain-containing protein
MARLTRRRKKSFSRAGAAADRLGGWQDGAIYFVTGGRGAQSELFRVTYVGDESTAPVEAKPDAAKPDGNAQLRQLRRKLEGYHGRSIDDRQDARKAIAEVIWPNLGHDDRFIRYAARVALEFQPLELWLDRALAEESPQALLSAAIAVAHRADSDTLPALLKALGRLEISELSLAQQLELLRAYQLAFARLGAPDEAARESLASKFDALYPAENDFLNRELCNLLVYLRSPSVVSKTIALLESTAESDAAADEQLKGLLERNEKYAAPIRGMLRNRPDPQKIHYAFALRNVKDGWTLDERRKYFHYLRTAAKSQGGNSFEGFLKNIDRDAYENASADEQMQIANAGLRPPFGAPELPKPVGPGQDWTVDQVVGLVDTKLKDRDFENGKKMFAAARCVVCHRFAGEGGSTGPDLTQLSGRFNAKDLTEAIIDPSKVISDQYQATTIIANGRTYSGRVVGEQKDKVMMLTNPEDNTEVATIRKDDIELRQPSKLSQMPTDLLKPLSEAEVLDLMAYLLSRGNPEDAMFRRNAVEPAAATGDARAESINR